MLKITAAFLRLKPPLIRILSASAVASLTSLYIFLPPGGAMTEILVRFVFCAAITLVGFGFKAPARFIRICFLLFLITFGFAGAMMAVWYIFSPSGMVIKNSVVYFDVSPTVLILSSAVFYFSSSIINFLWGRKNATAKSCEVTLFYNGKSIELTGILDTGNSITDPFTSSAVFLVNRKTAERLVDVGSSHAQSRFRVVPCKTVAGSALLNGYRIDKAVIKTDNKKNCFKNGIIAISSTDIAENGVIINPDILK